MAVIRKLESRASCDAKPVHPEYTGELNVFKIFSVMALAFFVVNALKKSLPENARSVLSGTWPGEPGDV